MIKVKAITFTYPGQNEHALDNVSLEVNPGEFVAILGRNGSGKSTLARLMAGFLMPGSGEILIDGISTGDAGQSMAVRQKVALLFSNPDNQLIAGVVEEDVAFGPENLGLPAAEIRKRVQAALAAVHMEDYAQSPLHLLSGGQKQRVAIAGVLALKPDYLILDEPTSMLDPQGRAEILSTLLTLNWEHGIGLVLITHFAEEAVMASRVIVLDSGRQVFVGPPAALFHRPDDLERWGLEAPETVVLVRCLREKGFDIPAVLTGEDLVRHLCRLNSTT